MLLQHWRRQHIIFSTLDHFEESLELLLKFTSSFTSSEDAVNHEKRIIEQEINMYQDDPDYRAYLGLFAKFVLLIYIVKTLLEVLIASKKLL